MTDAPSVQFRPRVAAVVRSARGVLLQRLAGDDFWSLPGGRIELGETAREALAREWREELAEEVVPGELRFVVENFFEYNGVCYHEVGLYFDAELPLASKLHSASSYLGRESTGVLEFAWLPLENVSSMAIRPNCLRRALVDDPVGLQHFVQRGDECRWGA